MIFCGNQVKVPTTEHGEELDFDKLETEDHSESLTEVSSKQVQYSSPSYQRFETIDRCNQYHNELDSQQVNLTFKIEIK